MVVVMMSTSLMVKEEEAATTNDIDGGIVHDDDDDKKLTTAYYNNTTTSSSRSCCCCCCCCHSKSKKVTAWIPIFIGSIIPDIPLLVFMIVEPMRSGDTLEYVLDVTYFHDPSTWQSIFGYFHSIPLSLLSTVVFAIPYVMLLERRSRNQQIRTKTAK